MSRRFDTHNRFAAALDSVPSDLEVLTLHPQPEQSERRTAGWRRSLAVGSLFLMFAAGVAMLIAR